MAIVPRQSVQIIALVLLSLWPAAARAQDAEAGRKLFRRCAACHALVPGPPLRAGPHLDGVVGRAIGSLSDYSYNGSLRNAGRAGGTWTEERLSQFIADPRAMFPDTKMNFAGIPSDQERRDLVAFLATLGDPAPTRPAAR
ncbi:c-type cytochrome [Cereibacter sp. SYSU M97828]|nr:c-type cytochrome [Cereibacter flavus]